MKAMNKLRRICAKKKKAGLVRSVDIIDQRENEQIE